MFQPDEVERLLVELSGRRALHMAFGEAMFHANRLHETAIRDLQKQIQDICIHPQVEHSTWEDYHKGIDHDHYKCLVCGKESEDLLK